MKPAPLFKKGDEAFIIDTPYMTGNLDMGGRRAVVTSDAVWSDDPATSSEAYIPGWSGPGGWTYYLDIADPVDGLLDQGRYHELEMVKVCRS
jgi:hypothetical protein